MLTGVECDLDSDFECEFDNNFDGNLPPPSTTNPERWTGRQLVSMAIPKGLNVNMKNNSYNEDIENDKLNHVIINDNSTSLVISLDF